jgi:hypothetical protein
MRKIILSLLFCFAMSTLLFAIEKPDEASLIKAWEEIQKTDPNTVTFEKIEDGLYKYKTKFFPFDGKLKIYDATIDNEEINGFNMGELVVELIKAPNNFYEKYRLKYSIWGRNNTLYYDKKAGRWLSPQEYRSFLAAKKKPSKLGMDFLFSWGPILFLVIVWVFFIKKLRRPDYMKKSYEYMERTEKLLERIAKAVEKDRDK